MYFTLSLDLFSKAGYKIPDAQIATLLLQITHGIGLGIASDCYFIIVNFVSISIPYPTCSIQGSTFLPQVLRRFSDRFLLYRYF